MAHKLLNAGWRALSASVYERTVGTADDSATYTILLRGDHAIAIDPIGRRRVIRTGVAL